MDAQTGRFLSEDPIGFAGQDQNLYRYVFSNPVNFKDPDGEIGLPGAVIGGIVGGVGGLVGSLAQSGPGSSPSIGDVATSVASGILSGALAGSGIGGALGAVGASVLGNLGGQALTKSPCDDFNISSAIGSGLGAFKGFKFGQLAAKAAGNSGLSTLVGGVGGLGTLGGGVVGTGIGQSTGF